MDSMSLFFKDEIEKEKQEMSALNFRNQRRNLKVLKQVGKTTKSIDEKRGALMPGKRVSKMGKTYWETRRNRTDAKGSNI